MASKLWKRYPKYKDSGVEWLGEIPESWEVKRLKFLTRQIIDGSHFTPTYVIEGVPFLRVTDIHQTSINFNEVKRIPEQEHQELIKRCKPEKGDLLLSKNGTIGIPKIVDWNEDFSIFVSLCLIKIKLNLYINYIKYYFLSNEINNQINDGGKTNTVTNLHLNKIKEFIFTVPLLSEQQKIAQFLDKETVKIDTLINKKQRLIELLKEKRTAIISHAVTKGLNPDVPMKDSGVEWLGMIPESWEVRKVKWVASKIGSGKTPKGGAEIYVDLGVIFLRSQNIHFDSLRLDDVAYIDALIDAEMRSTRVLPKDVLLNITGASLGRCSIIPDNFPPANVNQHVCIIRSIQTLVNPIFLNRAMSSDVIQTQIFLSEDGVSREGLTFSEIASLILALPTFEEQQKIAEYLDIKTRKIDTLINKIKTSIEYLKEYRTAIISAAVTGKIDVREEV